MKTRTWFAAGAAALLVAAGSATAAVALNGDSRAPSPAVVRAPTPTSDPTSGDRARDGSCATGDCNDQHAADCPCVTGECTVQHDPGQCPGGNESQGQHRGDQAQAPASAASAPAQTTTTTRCGACGSTAHQHHGTTSGSGHHHQNSHGHE